MLICIPSHCGKSGLVILDYNHFGVLLTFNMYMLEPILALAQFQNWMQIFCPALELFFVPNVALYLLGAPSSRTGQKHLPNLDTESYPNHVVPQLGEVCPVLGL